MSRPTPVRPRSAILDRPCHPGSAWLAARAGALSLLVVIACDLPGEGDRRGAAPRRGSTVDGAGGSPHRVPSPAAEYGGGSVVTDAEGDPRQVVHVSSGGRFVVLQSGDGGLEVRDGLTSRERLHVRDPDVHMADPQGADGRRGEWWPKAQPFVTIRFPGPGDRRGGASGAAGVEGASGSAGREASPAAVRAIARRVDDLETQLAALDGELAALWADPARPTSERRRLLFARWDECEEASSATVEVDGAHLESAFDGLRAHTGERARRTIEAFIRQNLPRGSADAFTDAELAEFNGRKVSRARFAPYEP